MAFNQAIDLGDYFVTPASFNRMIALLSDESFSDFIIKTRNDLENIKSFSQMSNTKKEIANFLYNRNYPLNWVEPIFNMIRSKDCGLDFPLDDGISLRIMDEIVTTNGLKTGLFLIRKDGVDRNLKISIEIDSDVSINRIVAFVKHFAPIIKLYMKKLNFPKSYNDKRPKAGLAYLINDMRVNKGMTYAEIANSSEMNELKIYDESSIRVIHARYLDLFPPPKK